MPLSDGAMQDYSLTLDKFLDHAAKWHPDAEVVTGGQRRIIYAALRTRAQAVSSVLAGLGVAPGDQVATLAWNTQEHVEAWYGIMGMGAVCHTLNPRLTPAQLAWMLERSGAAVLLADPELAGLAADIAQQRGPASLTIVVLGEEPAGRFAALDPLLRSAPPAPPWGGFDERSASGLCFTSGTTGAPKGVTYTHRANYLHTLRLLQADVLAITARDAVLPVVPMFHANAWGLPFACPAAGAKLVLPGRHSDGASLARLIEREGVTIAAGVPTVWLGLMDHLDRTGTMLTTLRRIMTGGAPMPRALAQRIESRGIEVQTTWGMTELSPLGTATSPGTGPADPNRSGRPAVGLDLKLTDGAGIALPEQRGVEGHLWVRGAAVVARYFGEEAPATRDGWFDTGDLARIAPDGSLEITGRAKDLIKSGGEWINPAEIEALISALPQVSHSAVIGRADPKWGERPVLVVEMRDGADPGDAELLGALEGKIAPWWIPREVIRLPRMPLAPTGKIDKLALRDQYQAA